MMSKESPRPCVIGCVLSTTVIRCGVIGKNPDCGCCTPRVVIELPQSHAPPITSMYSGQLCGHDASEWCVKTMPFPRRSSSGYPRCNSADGGFTTSREPFG